MKRIITMTLCAGITASVALAQTPAPATPPANAPNTAYTPDPITNTRQALAGKLFFSDDDRSKLNQIRKDGALPFDVIDGQPVERTNILNGFIKRSDGATTYWVNGGNASGTRYVMGSGVAAEVGATSVMVGGEPKVLLGGVAVGDKAVDDKKSKPTFNKQKKSRSAKAQLKKTKNNKKGVRSGAQK